MAVPKPIRTAAGSYTGVSKLHMSWMPEGQRLDEGPSKLHIEFDRHTKYAAPPGPDWGWRITLDSSGVDRMTMKMYNATPKGEEEIAVEAIYRME